MFKMFTFAEVVEYAQTLGYSKEDIEIVRVCTEYDYDLERETAWEYEVSFGHEDTEVWLWTFEDLDEQAVDYEHLVWED